MKGGQKLEGVQNQKLGALHIISHLIRREPVWIHKLVGHPLMSLVLRCLKVMNKIELLTIYFINDCISIYVNVFDFFV